MEFLEKSFLIMQLYGFILHPITIIVIILFFYFKNLFLGMRITELKDDLNNINKNLENINKTLEKIALIKAIETKNLNEK